MAHGLIESSKRPVETSESVTITVNIGRRIGEILEEKGDAYSHRAFGERVSISKDIMGRIASGTRYVKPSELSRIARGLKMPIARLKREDTMQREEELRSLVIHIRNPKRAVQLGLELFPLALGFTQKFEILNDLGSAYYYANDYANAHEAWLQALGYAEKIKEKYKERDALFKVLHNLIISHTEMKDYSSLSLLMKDLEPEFEMTTPLRAGTIKYSQALAANSMGRKSEYRQYMYESLHFFKKSGIPPQIGRALHNVAYLEYRFGNYQESVKLFESAIEYLNAYPVLVYYTLKDYAKALLKAKQTQQAITVIEDSLSALTKMDFPEITAKFYLLHAMVTNTPNSAEKVITLPLDDTTQQLRACRFLMDFFSNAGDAKKVMEYHKIAEVFRKSESSNWEEI